MVTSNLQLTLPISVVIPTLGGSSLVQTLQYLNSGPKIPAEILICIPDSHSHALPTFEWDNVAVLPTVVKGQVAQRAEGFKLASQPYILQLDDDMQISSDSMSELLHTLTALAEDAAVAPVYLDEVTGECIHKHPSGWRAFLSNMMGVLISGARWGSKRMGSITPAGTNYGVDSALMSERIVEVDWVPGGCLLHRQSNLCTDAFFPFSGKAYCEDLIHSILLKKKGVRLYVVKNATCKTEFPVLATGKDELKADMRARQYFNQLADGSQTRFLLWCAITYVKRGFR